MSALPSIRLPIITTALLLLGLAIAFASPKTESQPFQNPWSDSRFALLKVLSKPTVSTMTKADSSLSELGHTLFYDTTLNPETGLGCVSCHLPALAFSDGLSHPSDNPLKRNAPGLIGASQHRWQFWDGRKDSSWSQAISPIYAAHEIGLTPEELLQKLTGSPKYRALYKSAFRPWPQPLPEASSFAGMKLQAEIGLALEAFLNELQHQPAPFDHYVQALNEQDLEQAKSLLSDDQQAGLNVMLRSNCISCHRGSAFSDGQFHNIGTGGTDAGRAVGKALWQVNEFNCSSAVAEAIGRPCDINAVGEAEIPKLLHGAFKTPSLRELTHTAPYMHDGRFKTIAEVVEHYRNPPNAAHGLATIQPISDVEAKQLSEFLKALSSPIDNAAWYNNPPDE